MVLRDLKKTEWKNWSKQSKSLTSFHQYVDWTGLSYAYSHLTRVISLILFKFL